MQKNNCLEKAVTVSSDSIEKLLELKSQVIVAIDGRCGAGKTTFSECLKKELSCNVVHMDDFFLRPEQRTAERLELPGGNVDSERFLEEVLIPLKSGKRVSYRPFDCKKMDFKKAVELLPNKVTVVEGTYSCHPELWEYYDLHVFINIDSVTQLERIRERNGETMAKRFEELWIPLEEKYFSFYKTDEKCELLFELSNR